jgi:hypothetical protein
MTALAAWQTFYVIVGPSAGALIGLQFVALSLIANGSVGRSDAQASGAFATPTIVHFAAVLVLSAIMTAPWEGGGAFTTLTGLLGLSGVVYVVIVLRRMRAQTAYRPQFEDWFFHVLLPLAAYGMLAFAGAVAGSHLRRSLFAAASAALLLLLTGIHNTWDAVTYHVFVRKPTLPESAPRP